MARSPSSPTAGEVKIDLDGFKASVDKQFGYLNKLVFGLYTLLFAIVGGGFLLRADLGELKERIGRADEQIKKLQADVTATQTRTAAIEKNTGDLAAAQSQMNDLEGRIFALLNTRLPANGALQLLVLNPAEQQTIREFFGINKGPSINQPKFAVGDSIQGATPVPTALIDKVPQLRGYAYSTDPGNGAVLIVDQSNRVVALIAPA